MSETRGEVTYQIREKAKELLGYEDISKAELNLFPYVFSCITYGKDLNPSHVTKEDILVLDKWRKRGWITGGTLNLRVTQEFWEIMSEMIWIGFGRHK